MATALLAPSLLSLAAENQLIGSSPSLQKVRDAVHMVARTDSSVLSQGETGTGKELIARAIHEASPRSLGHHVKLNCALSSAKL